MKDPGTPEHMREERQENGQAPTSRQPFDTSDLDTIPTTNDDDPPYRNWWVVDR